MSILIVVDEPRQWPLQIAGVTRGVGARLPHRSGLQRGASGKVFNLCRSYRYQSLGYYVSLLAEARGHKPLPRVSTIEDLQSRNLVRLLTEGLEDLIQRSLAPIKSDEFELSIYFGRNVATRYDSLCQHLFHLVPAPLLRASFPAPARRVARAGHPPDRGERHPGAHTGLRDRGGVELLRGPLPACAAPRRAALRSRDPARSGQSPSRRRTPRRWPSSSAPPRRWAWPAS